MMVLFVAAALLLIALVTGLVLALEKRRPRPPPPLPPPARVQPPTKTNPFGVSGRSGAMILSRRVLANLPLPAPLEPEGFDDRATLVAPPHGAAEPEYEIEIIRPTDETLHLRRPRSR